MTILLKTKNMRNGRRGGLILLIALGMLALFSLLAVTYVVTASASRANSNSTLIKARNSNLEIRGTTDQVAGAIVRGTNDQTSPFYLHDFLGDVYGPNPLRSRFGNETEPAIPPNGWTLPASWCTQMASTTSPPRLPDVNLVKVSLFPNNVINGVGGKLSPYENEYNSRLMTILEGPLAGQSFRILKYVGAVRAPGSTQPPDPNLGRVFNNTSSDPKDRVGALQFTRWSNPLYVDPNFSDTAYSVVIDLNEVVGSKLTGTIYNAGGVLETVSYSLYEWLTRPGLGVQSLFYLRNGSTYKGYAFLINDAPFNSAGIGLNDSIAMDQQPGNTARPGFGTLDSRELMNPLLGARRVPLALLPNYDYLANGSLMGSGITGVNIKKRTSISEYLLNGASNEGYDVPDWRDFWLAHQSYGSSGPSVIPSFHRPELFYYISNLFGDPHSLSAQEVGSLLQMLDASTARVLSYSLNGSGKNIGFRTSDKLRPRYDLTWSNPPTAAEVQRLQAFVASQINGPWDYDNDGDGFNDSVLIPAGLPPVYASDGRMLKAVAAVLIEDLDGRINVNTSGDRSQGLVGNLTLTPPDVGFGSSATGRIFKRKVGSVGTHALSQGFGYGPADISLNSLFNNTSTLLRSFSDSFSFFDDRYGVRRYTRRPINYLDADMDRMPGKRLAGTWPANDPSSQINERELHLGYSQAASAPGMPIGRRTSIGTEIDLNGNLAFTHPITTDGNPYFPGAVSALSETEDDPYEINAMTAPNSDDPFGIAELATVLLQYEGSVGAMPQRLADRLGEIASGGTPLVNRLVTTRSAELRYPNLTAALRDSSAYGTTIDHQMASFMQWIKALHAQHYQRRTLPVANPLDDPELTYRAIEELFPVDFTRGLRMDLNRPFGNGFDDDGDLQVDEPDEIASGQTEVMSAGIETNPASPNFGRPVPTTAIGSYARELEPNMGASTSGTRERLSGRQVFARNLYCLAQLIIPRDYPFPGMTVSGSDEAARRASARTWTNLKIRAATIAQWAANVVDFRDSDIAMTRFEYDILPFGAAAEDLVGFPTSPFPGRPAYWAPDHLDESVGGVANKVFVGVVWGMEAPELLLTESLALHDVRIRDTNMETSTGKFFSATDPNLDPDFDQYRFPLASLFLELYCPRTTDTASLTAPSSLRPIGFEAHTLLPGVAASTTGSPLYDTVAGNVVLDLGKTAPPATGWGVQPVWRIAISEYDATTNPAKLSSAALANVTHQKSTTAAINGAAWSTSPLPSSPDSVTGNGLQYDITSSTTMSPVIFDRFVWFTTTGPSDTQPIPDLAPTLASNSRRTVYYNRGGSAYLQGGSYMVVGPRSETSIGSSSYNRFDSVSWKPILDRSDLASTTDKPRLTPSFQKIDLSAGNVTTRLLNDTVANAPWMSHVKTAVPVICATDEPDDPAVPAASDWTSVFPSGVGLNVSFPTPIAGSGIWTAANRPTTVLNDTDTVGTRGDGSGGFASFPPDSWINVGPMVPTGNLPNHPFDVKQSMSAPPIANTEIAKLAKDNPLGTHENIRAAYLQRLADPELAYDPIQNPYITVDWISIDLHVFNGEAPNPLPHTMAPNPTKFQSRYKSGSFATIPYTAEDGSTSGFSYHSPITASLEVSLPQTDPPTASQASYFKHQLGYRTALASWTDLGNSGTTLGYLNAGFTKTPSVTTGTRLTLLEMANGYGTHTPRFDGFGPPIWEYESAPGSYSAIAARLVGAPKNIVGATWFNRPFASPFELMMVPTTGAGQFGVYHSAHPLTAGIARKPFGFLPSFQVTTPHTHDDLMENGALKSYWMQRAAGVTIPEIDLSLLFELVETEPPFLDANRYLNMNMIQNLVAGPTAHPLGARFLNSYTPAGYYYQPGFTPPNGYVPKDVTRGTGLVAPFNKIPSYVAAGKVNLNTVSVAPDLTVPALKAVENNFLAQSQRGIPNDTTYNFESTAFINNRRGYVPDVGTSPFFTGSSYVFGGLNHNYPTQFAGALRPASSGNIAPYVPNSDARAKLRARHGIETTLMRSLSATSYPASGAIDDQNMLFSSPESRLSTDLGHQHPYKRFDRVMRLPNLVTNQSNVFAVWVSVSLYEYDPIQGYGNEYLDELGQPKREKMFYIIDRTVPVGYKPGEDLNTDRMILFKRKLD